MNCRLGKPRPQPQTAVKGVRENGWMDKDNVGWNHQLSISLKYHQPSVCVCVRINDV